jgi:preprotein translocase subunit YajC
MRSLFSRQSVSKSVGLSRSFFGVASTRLSGLFLAGVGALFSAQAAWAQAQPAVPAGTAGAAAPQQPSPLMSLVPMVLMFAVAYFLLIRPQQKKMKEQREMLSALKEGDEVLTTSGILAKVAGIADRVVTLEVADRVRIKMLKSQVAQVVKGQIPESTQ